MSTPAITFDQIERNADRTLAIVLLAKQAKNYATGLVLFAALHQLLRSLIRSLSNEKMNSLSDEQAKELTATLQQIHAQLVGIIDHDSTCSLKRKSLFKPLIDGIEENTEDLCDIIEDLVLSCNQNFRTIVSDCVQSIVSVHSAEPVGRV